MGKREAVRVCGGGVSVSISLRADGEGGGECKQETLNGKRKEEEVVEKNDLSLSVMRKRKKRCAPSRPRCYQWRCNALSVCVPN